MPINIMAGRRVLIAVLLISVSMNEPAWAGQERSVGTLLWRTPVYYAANHLLSVYVHEYSHALTGICMGYRVDQVHIRFTEGRVDFKEEEHFSLLQRDVMLFSGPASNRLLAWGANRILDHNESHMDEYARSFLGMTYMSNRLDFSFYMLHSYAGALMEQEVHWDDWTTLAYDLAGRRKSRFYVVMTVFAGLTIWDIVASIGELKKNSNRVIGYTVHF